MLRYARKQNKLCYSGTRHICSPFPEGMLKSVFNRNLKLAINTGIGRPFPLLKTSVSLISPNILKYGNIGENT